MTRIPSEVVPGAARDRVNLDRRAQHICALPAGTPGVVLATFVFYVLALSARLATPASAGIAGSPVAKRPHLLHTPQEYEQRRLAVQPDVANSSLSETMRTAALALTNPNVVYHGGSVTRTSTVYTIYWGPPPDTIPDSYQTLIDRWFTDVGGSALYNVLTQYYEGNPPLHIQNASTLGGSWMDTVNPYPHAGTFADPLLDSDIRAEVERAIAANGWPNGGLNAAFFVFTAEGIESCADATDCTIGTAFPAYCAYHWSFFSASSDVILYANMPYAGTWSSGFPYNCGIANPSPNDDPDADVEISIASHEQFEIVSDPLGDAWYDRTGEEIADKCAYQYGSVAVDGSNVTVNGNPYLVQEEWSNASTTCVRQYSSVNSPPTTTRSNTPTRTATRVATATSTPSRTATRTLAPTRTVTPVPTPTPTFTRRATSTRTLTRTATATITKTRTATRRPTSTRTLTPTATPTRRPTRTPTLRPTSTRTTTRTPTVTRRPARTLTPTRTP